MPPMMTRVRQTNAITYNRRVPATANGGAVALSYSCGSRGSPAADATGRVPPALRFTWQGREYSRATALYNFRARWYDPASGRWLSKDPIGLEGGLNLYEAFGNNPVCFRDPTGLDIYLHCERGHTELYIDDLQSKQGQTLFGFSPKTGGWNELTLDVIYGDSTVELRDYKVPKYEDCIRIKTTPEQDRKALLMAQIIKESNLRYSVLLNNCSHVTRLVLRTVGLPLGMRIFDSPSILKKDVQKYLKGKEK